MSHDMWLWWFKHEIEGKKIILRGDWYKGGYTINLMALADERTRHYIIKIIKPSVKTMQRQL